MKMIFVCLLFIFLRFGICFYVCRVHIKDPMYTSHIKRMMSFLFGLFVRSQCYFNSQNIQAIQV